MSASGLAGTAPLSVAQEGLWYTTLLGPERLSYNEAISFRHDGPIEPDAVRRALEEIVRRHEAWRTTFEVRDGQAAQVVHPPRRVELPVLDLGRLTPQEARRRSVSLVAEVASAPYDLARGPLLRALLIRYPGEHHRLYLAMHHVIFDGVSLAQIVQGELQTLYGGLGGGEVALPDPPRYTAYARWEQEWISGPRAARRLVYWRERLAGFSTAPRLPADRERESEHGLRGGALALAMTDHQVKRLRELGRERSATMFQVLAGIWSVLLHRYSGEAEVTFATPADLRQRPEFREVVGYCLTPLVLRVDLHDDPSFSELLGRVRGEVLDGLDHLVPFERIVRELQPATAAGENPIYNTMVVLEPAAPGPEGEWTVHQLESEVCDAVGNAKLDLELQLDERAGGAMVGNLLYDRLSFDRPTAQRIAAHWLALVDAVIAQPDTPVSRLALLPEAERRQVVVEWNATASVAEPGDRPTQAMISALGLGAGDVVLVAIHDGLALRAARSAGARVVELDRAARDGAAVSRILRQERASVLIAAAQTWAALLDTGLRPARGLRGVSLGVLAPEVAEAALERCRAVWNVYGTAETGGCATIGRVTRPARAVLGRPVAGNRAYVLDRHGEPQPIGVAGELVIAGATVAEGFGEDRFAGGPAFPTGERARWLADGTLELVRL